MKRRLAAIVFGLGLIPIGALQAYDDQWGLNLKLNLELPELHGSSASISQKNALGFWYRGSWNIAANIEIDSGVNFDTNWVFGFTNASELSFHGFKWNLYPVFDKMNFFGNTGKFGYKVGRQIIGDPAGLILDAPADGTDFTFEAGGHLINSGVAYTGLVFGRSAKYFLVNGDVQRFPDQVLALPRLLEYVSWALPSAAPWFSPSVYFLAVQDLSSSEDQDRYGSRKFDTMYLQLRARGFLGKGFFYELALTGQYGWYGSATVLAGVGKAGISVLPGPRTRLGIEVLAATGDDWSRNSYKLSGRQSGAKLNQYLPVSIVSTRGFAAKFELGNLTSLAAYFTMRPSKTFAWEIRTTTFLRNVIGPISYGSLSKTDQGSFLGQEAVLGFLWSPKSDFSWDLKVGVLYPGESIVLDTYIDPYFPVLYRIGFNFLLQF